MSKPAWRERAEKSLRKMGYEPVVYFDWNIHGKDIMPQQGSTTPSPMILNYSQQRKNGQRL